MSIFVDEEFQNLIPPLSKEEYTQLEANCVKDGIRDPLVVWDQGDGNSILIDGHNRWQISAAHGGIMFKTVSMEFDSREDAKLWIIRNQLGRRNINNYVKLELTEKIKPQLKEKAQQNQLRGKSVTSEPNGSKVDVSQIIADIAHVGRGTVERYNKVQQKAPEEMKQALRRGDMSINAAHSMIVASENEDRRQREARELREAKHRAEDYQTDDGKIADFGKVKQHKEDNSLIFQEFADEFRKMYTGILRISGNIEEDITMNAIKAADAKDLKKIADDLMFSYRCILKIQKKIAEVIDEK